MSAWVYITLGTLTNLRQLLQSLTHEIFKAGAPVHTRSITWEPYPDDNPKNPGKLTQDFLWPVSFPIVDLSTILY